MLDIAKATKILEHHFATVTPDELIQSSTCGSLMGGCQPPRIQRRRAR
jgi:hypothetical protein